MSNGHPDASEGCGGCGGGGGGGGGGAAWPFGQWVRPRPLLGPYPDVYTDHDRQRNQVVLIQGVKGGQGLTHRESRRCRDPNLGNVPYPVANQGLPPFPLNPHDKVYDNHLLLPSLIDPLHFKTLFGFSSEDFYRIRDSYVIPITSAVSRILTPDAITSLYLFKMRENLDFDSLGMIYGVGRESARYWFNQVFDSIATSSPFLHLLQNLSDNNCLRELYEQAHSATCRNETLSAVFMGRLQAYERRVGRQGEMKLVVLALDSNHLSVQTPSNHDALKRTYSSKVGHNAVVCQAIASPDGMPCWMGCLSASTSPSNTDERQANLFFRLNAQGNLVGGLADFLTGPMEADFFTVLLMDKGYKTYGRGAVGQMSFKDGLDQLVQVSQGRFQYEFPPDKNDPWKDKHGAMHASPVPRAGAGLPQAPDDLQMDLTANSGSVFCTKFRHSVENLFLRLWRERYFERGTGVHNSLLKPYDKLPHLDSPKLQVALQNSMALQYEFGTPFAPTFTLPNGVTRSDLGRRMVDFESRRNFLDEYAMDLTWNRVRGVWPTVINAERNGIIVREGNLMDPNFTQFPPLTEEQLHEVGGGSYQTRLARQYGTNLVNLFANNANNGNDTVQLYNQRRSQAPAHVYCYFWDQVHVIRLGII